MLFLSSFSQKVTDRRYCIKNIQNIDAKDIVILSDNKNILIKPDNNKQQTKNILCNFKINVLEIIENKRNIKLFKNNNTEDVISRLKAKLKIEKLLSFKNKSKLKDDKVWQRKKNLVMFLIKEGVSTKFDEKHNNKPTTKGAKIKEFKKSVAPNKFKI